MKSGTVSSSIVERFSLEGRGGVVLFFTRRVVISGSLQAVSPMNIAANACTFAIERSRKEEGLLIFAAHATFSVSPAATFVFYFMQITQVQQHAYQGLRMHLQQDKFSDAHHGLQIARVFARGSSI